MLDCAPLFDVGTALLGAALLNSQRLAFRNNSSFLSLGVLLGTFNGEAFLACCQGLLGVLRQFRLAGPDWSAELLGDLGFLLFLRFVFFV